MLLRTPSPILPGLSTGICNGTSHRVGWITPHPWVRGNYSVSTGILSYCKPELLKHTVSRTEHTPLKRAKGGVLVWCIRSQSISSCLTELPALTNMYGMHNQGKFLKLPTSISWGPDRYISVSYWYDYLAAMFVSSIGLGNGIACIEALPKSTQEALNQGSPPPGLWTSTGLWPVKNRAIQ